jgi:hypothetical protein
MTRVHVLVVALLLLTVVIHATMASLVGLASRRLRSRRDPSSRLDLGPSEPIKKARRAGGDRAVIDSRGEERRRSGVVYGTCARCGTPISLTHSTRRRLRRAAKRPRRHEPRPPSPKDAR